MKSNCTSAFIAEKDLQCELISFQVFTTKHISLLVSFTYHDLVRPHMFRLYDVIGTTNPQCLLAAVDEMTEKAYQGTPDSQLYIIRVLGNIGKLIQVSRRAAGKQMHCSKLSSKYQGIGTHTKLVHVNIRLCNSIWCYKIG